MDDREKLWDTIKDIRTGMLTTSGPQGLESRPMSASVDREAGKLWFITRIDSSKTTEIADDSDINVSFGAHGANSWVSVTGKARVVRDAAKAKQLWSPFAEAWMPEGPEAPTTALIEVTPSHATLWDEPNKLVQLFQVAAANITQKPPSGGEVTHVAL
ncbi:pyridoxamine 5'-phosphate oxidase family protein [Sphingosinicellaceae bacterium]|nr:pyridoxamine 5'-phosphate oxidase family protein [Sphingosinicellaceae bacterium]